MVRVIEYTLDDPLRTGPGETHRLLTNLLDSMMFPARELICLDHERWEAEQVDDEQKTHQDPRRPTKPAHFRSQTPEGVEQEIYALSLAHFVVRALMLEAAKQEHQDADRLSFTGCFQILQARLPECQSSTPAELEQWYRLLLEEMAQERTEPRRKRINPRVVSARCRSSPRNVPRIAANRRLRKPLLSQWLSLDERYWVEHAEEQWSQPGTCLQPHMLGGILLPAADRSPVVATVGEGEPATAPGPRAGQANGGGAVRLVEEHGAAVVGEPAVPALAGRGLRPNSSRLDPDPARHQLVVSGVRVCSRLGRVALGLVAIALEAPFEPVPLLPFPARGWTAGPLLHACTPPVGRISQSWSSKLTIDSGRLTEVDCRRYRLGIVAGDSRSKT